MSTSPVRTSGQLSRVEATGQWNLKFGTATVSRTGYFSLRLHRLPLTKWRVLVVSRSSRP